MNLLPPLWTHSHQSCLGLGGSSRQLLQKVKIQPIFKVCNSVADSAVQWKGEKKKTHNKQKQNQTKYLQDASFALLH